MNSFCKLILLFVALLLLCDKIPAFEDQKQHLQQQESKKEIENSGKGSKSQRMEELGRKNTTEQLQLQQHQQYQQLIGTTFATILEYRPRKLELQSIPKSPSPSSPSLSSLTLTAAQIFGNKPTVVGSVSTGVASGSLLPRNAQLTNALKGKRNHNRNDNCVKSEGEAHEYCRDIKAASITTSGSGPDVAGDNNSAFFADDSSSNHKQLRNILAATTRINRIVCIGGGALTKIEKIHQSENEDNKLLGKDAITGVSIGNDNKEVMAIQQGAITTKLKPLVNVNVMNELRMPERVKARRVPEIFVRLNRLKGKAKAKEIIDVNASVTKRIEKIVEDYANNDFYNDTQEEEEEEAAREKRIAFIKNDQVRKSPRTETKNFKTEAGIKESQKLNQRLIIWKERILGENKNPTGSGSLFVGCHGQIVERPKTKEKIVTKMQTEKDRFRVLNENGKKFQKTMKQKNKIRNMSTGNTGGYKRETADGASKFSSKAIESINESITEKRDKRSTPETNDSNRPKGIRVITDKTETDQQNTSSLAQNHPSSSTPPNAIGIPPNYTIIKNLQNNRMMLMEDPKQIDKNISMGGNTNSQMNSNTAKYFLPTIIAKSRADHQPNETVSKSIENGANSTVYKQQMHHHQQFIRNSTIRIADGSYGNNGRNDNNDNSQYIGISSGVNKLISSEKIDYKGNDNREMANISIVVLNTLPTTTQTVPTITMSRTVSTETAATKATTRGYHTDYIRSTSSARTTKDGKAFEKSITKLYVGNKTSPKLLTDIVTTQSTKAPVLGILKKETMTPKPTLIISPIPTVKRATTTTNNIYDAELINEFNAKTSNFRNNTSKQFNVKEEEIDDGGTSGGLQAIVMALPSSTITITDIPTTTITNDNNSNNSMLPPPTFLKQFPEIISTTATSNNYYETTSFQRNNSNNSNNILFNKNLEPFNFTGTSANYTIVSKLNDVTNIPSISTRESIRGASNKIYSASDTISATTVIPSITTTSTAITATSPTWPVKHASIVDGDIILGGLMMVHSREDFITCGPIMPQGGIQALEAMLYTIDQVNRQQLLPNVTLGAHILDDCDKDTYGLEMAVDFIKGW